MKDKKEKKEKTKFNLAFDNLAIPEVHIGGNAHGQGNVEHKHPDADGEMEEEVVTFADVAIPEIHITSAGVLGRQGKSYKYILRHYFSYVDFTSIYTMDDGEETADSE